MGGYMELKKGDLVTRKSYNNDIVFTIIDIIDDVYYLKGINVRLYADSDLTDLQKYEKGNDVEDEKDFIDRVKPAPISDRDDYFYLPGKILHIDGDKDYLNRCLKYYSDANIMAVGKLSIEDDISYQIRDWLEEYNPNIVVITGHDAYYKKKGSIKDIKAYKNSHNFINAIKEARKYEKSHEKLIIIAGACQSDYEDLIRAGANFASSPKRINIHALDPAIIAISMARADINSEIDVKKILENTKYGSNGLGGIRTKGTMYIGYPR